MTNPESSPPNPQAPHPPTHQEQQTTPPPVIVQPQQPDTGLIERVDAMGRILAGLPEKLVNSVREATLPQQQPQAQPPAQQSTEPASQQQQNAAPPATNTTDAADGGKGRQPTRLAKWWYGK